MADQRCANHYTASQRLKKLLEEILTRKPVSEAGVRGARDSKIPSE